MFIYANCCDGKPQWSCLYHPCLSVYTDFHRCGEDFGLIAHPGHPTNCLSSFRAAQRDPTTRRNLLSRWSQRWSPRETRKTSMTKNPSLMNILSLHQSPRRPYKGQGMYVEMQLLFYFFILSVSQYCNETLLVFCCGIKKQKVSKVPNHQSVTDETSDSFIILIL